MLFGLQSLKSALPYDVFSDIELSSILKNTNHSRYSLAKRLMAGGKLVHLKRGLYLLGDQLRRHPVNLFVLAQKMYGPSYVSFESALSHHSWIPEAVYTVSSASIKRSKEIKNSLGVFSYKKVVADPFLTQVDCVSTEEGNYYIASPWRALADYVYVYQKDWKNLDPLIRSLRIEEEHFERINIQELEELMKVFSHYRVRRFLKGVLRSLK